MGFLQSTSGLDVQAVLRLHGSLTTRFLNNTVYFGTLICPFSTKSLLRLHGFLLTWLFFQSLKNRVSRGPSVQNFLQNVSLCEDF